MEMTAGKSPVRTGQEVKENQCRKSGERNVEAART